jgi:hypothetical protein
MHYDSSVVWVSLSVQLLQTRCNPVQLMLYVRVSMYVNSVFVRCMCVDYMIAECGVCLCADSDSHTTTLP